MFKKAQHSLREKFPWYVNHSLSSQEQDEVKNTINQDAQARSEIEAWQQIRSAMISLPQQVPSPLVRQRVMTLIHSPISGKKQASQWGWSFLAGALLTFSMLILLWLALRPGVVLQWSLERDGMTSYRIYRASLGSSQFELIKEIPARADRQQYSFVDAFVLPGRNYVYRVEGVRSDGVTSLSPIVTGGSRDVIPGQLSVIMTSLIVGYGIVIFLRNWMLIVKLRSLEHLTG